MNPAPSLYSSRTFIDIQGNNKVNIPKVRGSVVSISRRGGIERVVFELPKKRIKIE